MNILKKLGITPQRVYKHLFKNGTFTNLYNNFEINIWPAYSEMLEALIESIEYIQSPQVFDMISPDQAGLHDYLVYTLEKATGKTWDEGKK